ncbi:hypothetical protein [Prosthecobacter sp.]|uniref:hypothetical protein n=1 Tax=Prosthecobacter sp. TaxID=1965333 RepID=UPI0037836D00
MEHAANDFLVQLPPICGVLMTAVAAPCHHHRIMLDVCVLQLMIKGLTERDVDESMPLITFFAGDGTARLGSTAG